MRGRESGPEDMDVAELHDCFSIAEIVDSEDLGFFNKGEGGPNVARGARNAKVVINPSGGLLSKGSSDRRDRLRTDL